MTGSDEQRPAPPLWLARQWAGEAIEELLHQGKLDNEDSFVDLILEAVEQHYLAVRPPALGTLPPSEVREVDPRDVTLVRHYTADIAEAWIVERPPAESLPVRMHEWSRGGGALWVCINCGRRAEAPDEDGPCPAPVGTDSARAEAERRLFDGFTDAFIQGAEWARAEERAARASLAPFISKMREVVLRFSDSDDVLSAWMDLEDTWRALAGASTPAEREEQE